MRWKPFLWVPYTLIRLIFFAANKLFRKTILYRKNCYSMFSNKGSFINFYFRFVCCINRVCRLLLLFTQACRSFWLITTMAINMYMYLYNCTNLWKYKTSIPEHDFEITSPWFKGNCHCAIETDVIIS